jgi:hypothetical protein
MGAGSGEIAAAALTTNDGDQRCAYAASGGLGEGSGIPLSPARPLECTPVRAADSAEV